MTKIFKWTGIALAGVSALALAGFAWIYVASEREIGRVYEVSHVTPPALPTDAAAIAEGKRIAQLAGCLHCHGDDLAGTVVDDIPNLVRLVAPNVSVTLPQYSDAELATMLRKGVKPDGTSVLFMPSEMFRHLDDADLARLIAWLRTVPRTPIGVQERTELRPLGRMILAKGDLKTAASAIATLPPAAAGYDTADPVSRGRYLTQNFCSECHGQNFEGFAPINAPPLMIAKAYSLEQFARLMHEGIPAGDRELKLMGPTSRVRFSHLSADEVAAVHAFLQTL